MRTYSKRNVSHSSRRNKKHRGGQAPDVTKNIQDAVTRMKTMSLAQLNLAVSAAFLKYFIAMINPASQQSFMPALGPYFRDIPVYFKTNTPAEFAAFSESMDPQFAAFMLIGEKFAPPDIPLRMPQPTKVDSGLSQKLSSLFSTLKTITPGEAKTQSENVMKIIMELPRLSRESEQIYIKRFQEELIPQLVPEIHKELLKTTPEQLVSYPIWPAIVKYTPFRGGENNPVNHLMMIGNKTIFLPIMEELLNKGTSSSTTRPAPMMAPQAATTTRPAPMMAPQAPTMTRPAPMMAPQAATTTRPATTTTRPLSKIPAGIVSWLNADINNVPNKLKSSVTTAINSIKTAYPAETTPTLVQAAANKLTVL